jgi:glutathione S-transferase
VAGFTTDDLRYSVSWKAYCFADAAERDAWASHDDDLELEQILATLETDMRRRGVLAGEQPTPADFGRRLIATYIAFPAAEGSDS